MPDDKTQYSPEFKEQLNAEVVKLYSQGRDDAYVDQFIGAYKDEYKKKVQTEPGDNIAQPREKEDYELPDGYEEPKWYSETGLGYRDEKKRRRSFWKTVMSVGSYIADPRTDGKPKEEYTVNKIVEDKLTPDMVTHADDMHEKIMKFSDKDKWPEQIDRERESMRKRFNPDGHKPTNRNIDLLLESAWMPEMEAQVRSDVSKYTKQGYDPINFFIGDPEVLKRLKKEYRNKGWSGDIVDQAMSKVFDEHRDEALLADRMKSISAQAKELAKEEGISEDKAIDILSNDLENQWRADAEDRFDKNAMKRYELITQLEKLRKQRDADPREAEKIQEKIDVIDKKLGIWQEVDQTKTAFPSGILSAAFPYAAVPTQVILGLNAWRNPKHKNKYGLYDANGDYIVQEGDTEAKIEFNKDVATARREIESRPNFEQNLKENGFKSYLMLQRIKQERALVEGWFKDRPALMLQSEGAMERAGVDPKALAQKRKLNHILEVEHEYEVLNQAYSRSLFTNENLALAEKNSDYYYDAAWKELRDINKLSGEKAIKSDADMHEYMRKIYSDMGHPMTEDEVKNTHPDLTLDMVKGGVVMGDLVGKLMVMDAIGSTLGVNGLIHAIGSGTKTLRFGPKVIKTKAFNKIAANIVGAAWEGTKFQAVEGDYATGFLFSEAQAALGGIERIVPKRLRPLVKLMNHSAVGMTVSMEAVAQVDAMYEALTYNKDVIRAVEETFGTVDEASRRILIELATAAPFGVRAFKNLTKSGAFKTDSQVLLKLAKEADKKGETKNAELFRSFEAALSASEGRQENRQTEARKEWLDSEGAKFVSEGDAKKLDKAPSKKEVNEIYEKTTAEAEVGDPILEQYGDFVDRGIYDAKFAHDQLQDHYINQTLKDHGIKVKGKTPREVRKAYDELVKEINSIYGEMPVESYDGLKYETKNQKQVKSEVSAEEAALRSVKAEIKKATGRDASDPVKFSEKIIAAVRDMEKRVGNKTFRGIVEQFSELKGGYAEFQELVRTTDQIKTKKGLAERIDHIEDILHKVDVITKPKEPYVSLTSDVPKEKIDFGITANEAIKRQMKDAEKGWKEGRKQIIQEINGLNKFLADNLSGMVKANPNFLKEAGLTLRDIKKILSPISETVSYKVAKKRLKKYDDFIEALETRATRNRIASKLKKAPTNVDFVTSSKLEVAQLLFGDMTQNVKKLQAKLEAVREFAEPAYEQRLIDAQLAALEYAGNRVGAMERKIELGRKGNEMTQKEMLEYEMLEFVGGKEMPLFDLQAAEANLKSITETGRSFHDRKLAKERWMRESDRELAAKALGEDITDLDARQNWDTKLKLVGKLMSDYKITQDSFLTLMEDIMLETPGREMFGGFFHTISADFHRASEHSKAKFLEFNVDMINAQREIFKTDDVAVINKRMKANRKTHDIHLTIGDKYQSIGKRSVNQIYRLWQQLHDPTSHAGFEKQLWGVSEGKFNSDKLKAEMEEFIIEHGGKETLEWAKWQLEEFYPKVYVQANSVYRRINNHDLGWNLMYTPRVIETDGTKGDINEIMDKFDAKGENYFIATATHAQMKERRGPGGTHNTMVDGDAILQRYAEKMAHYMYYQEPLNRSKRVFNDPSISKALAQKYGGNYINTIIGKFHKDIGANRGTGLRIPKMDAFAINITRAHLGLNLGLWPKQMVSMDAYRSMLPSGLQAEFTKNTLLNPDFFKTYRELGKSMFAQNRKALAGFNIELARIEKEASNLAGRRGAKIVKGGKDWWKLDSMKDNMLILGKLGDIMAIQGGGTGFYTTMRNNYIKKGFSEADAKAKAYNDFVTATKLTQQSGDVVDRSHIQRAGSLGRLMSLYQNTPQQYRRMEAIARDNMIQGAIDMIKYKKGSEEHTVASQKLRKSTSNFLLFHFLLPGMFRAASQWFYAGDAELMDDKGMMVALLLGSLSYEFMIGDILKNVAGKVITGHAFDPEAMPIAQSVLDNVMKIADVIRDASTEEPIKYHDTMDAIYDYTKKFQVVSELAGIPLMSPVSLVKGWHDLVTGKTDDYRALVGLSESGRGAYERSPDAPIIHKFQKDNKSLGEFINYMNGMHHTDREYFMRNTARWQREWRMYKEFGMYDSNVNLLYSGGLTNKQKADYLYKLKYKNFTVADASMGLIHEMNTTKPYQIANYVRKLVRFRVIDPQVLMELRKLEREKGK